MFQWATYQLKAGALQFVTYIVIVIALLLSMLLLYTHLNVKFMAQGKAQIEAIRLAENSIIRCLHEDFDGNDSLVLTSGENTFVSIKTTPWGIFDLVIAKSRIRDKSFEKSALIGGKTPLDIDLALCIQDHAQALQVAGNTSINGNAYVGRYGIKPGQIKGRYYTNDKLVYGEIIPTLGFPELKPEKENHLNNLQDYYSKENQNPVFFDLSQTSQLSQSFFKPAKYFYASEPVFLFSKQLSGHIIIQSGQHIYVDASNQLKDVVLIAPEITIGPDFKGQIQAVATQTLSVGTGVDLDYPSALVITPKRHSENKLPQLHIAQDCKIKGSIAYLKGDLSLPGQNAHSHVFVGESTKVYGQIYSSYNLELKGTVYGHVLANQFLTEHEGNIYINHLLDTRIIAQPVSAEFGGLLFNQNQVVSWMY